MEQEHEVKLPSSLCGFTPTRGHLLERDLIFCASFDTEPNWWFPYIPCDLWFIFRGLKVSNCVFKVIRFLYWSSFFRVFTGRLGLWMPLSFLPRPSPNSRMEATSFGSSLLLSTMARQITRSWGRTSSETCKQNQKKKIQIGFAVGCLCQQMNKCWT